MTVQRNPFLTMLCCLFVLLFACFRMDTAFAEDKKKTDDVTLILCNVQQTITGTAGKVIAVIMLAALAIGLFLGKVTWGLAIATMVGMGLLFGAGSAVDTITRGVGGDKQQAFSEICKAS